MPLEVLFVSKPIAPPFHDGTKCLVRDVATHLERARPMVLSTAHGEAPTGAASVRLARVYSDAGAFTPTLSANARAALWILARSRADVWHFVFAPNRASSTAGRWLRRLRRVPVVQTIASAPRSFHGIDRLLFGDVVVAQSTWTRDRTVASYDAAGRRPPRIEVIPPPVARLSAVTEAQRGAVRRALDVPDDAQLVVYPGDLETSCGAETVVRLVEPVCRALPRAVFVFACRPKTPEAPRIRGDLCRRLDPGHVRFPAAGIDVLSLFATASVVLFPVDDLWGKVDLPISLLEAMALGVPVVAYAYGPIRDLQGAVLVPLGDEPALRAAVIDVARDAARSMTIAAAQREAVSARYSAPVVARRYEALYEEIGPS